MRGSVLISLAGSHSFAREIAAASCIRLLRRGAVRQIHVLLDEPISLAQEFDDVHYHAEAEWPRLLESHHRLVIAGEIDGPASFDRILRQVVTARLSNVPVALVSIRIDVAQLEPGQVDLLELLCASESISVADGSTAAALQPYCRSRVATTAPLELVLAARRQRPRQKPRIGVARAVLEAWPRLGQELPRLVAKFGGEFLCVSTGEPGHAAQERTASDTWLKITSCHVWLDRPGSVGLQLAAANGVTPVPVGGRCELSRRIGLDGLFVEENFETARLGELLESALALEGDNIRTRTAPLRIVAWRALGIFCDARRSCHLSSGSWNPTARRFLGDCLYEVWSTVIERGEDCREILNEWQAQLSQHPRWLEMSARIAGQLGNDRQAEDFLDRALELHPGDVSCWALRALVAWRLGDRAAAQQAWNRVKQLNPSEAQAGFQLGCLRLFEQDWDAASKELQQATDLAPERPEIRKALELAKHQSAVTRVQRAARSR